MEILGVNQVLSEDADAARRLVALPLRVLEPTPNPYFALLCQPHGLIHSSADRIGNADSAAAAPLYRRFLEEAVRTQAQLAVTPEYSVPWLVIDDIIEGGLRPSVGALWTLGFESITPDELTVLAARFAARQDVRFIHEAFDPTERAQKRFVDPLVHVFWCRRADGASALCVLVQFKTIASRDDDHVEIAALYLGRRVYKFNENTADIALLGIVCSDAFAFANELVRRPVQNLLVVHVQLNQRPGHDEYAAYRARLFADATDSNVEILCLNWAAGVVVQGHEAATWNTVSGSGWYVPPRGAVVRDDDVNSLHARGVYYSLVNRRWHGFFLNYSPHSILLRKRPVFARGPQVLAPPLPPQVVERKTWDVGVSAWVDADADDGFSLFAQTYSPLDTMLPDLCSHNPLSVERSLELLNGPNGSPATWFALPELDALRVDREESLRRITVSQEVDPMRAGVAFRRERARRAQAAATLHTAAIQWPPAVADLANGLRFRWSSNEPHCNVEPIAGGRPATLLYLGDNPEPDLLAALHQKLLKALQGHAASVGGAGADEAFHRAADRLCIVYRANHTLMFHRDPRRTSITNPRTDGNDDITGDNL